MELYRDMHGIWVREPYPAELMGQFHLDINEIDTSRWSHPDILNNIISLPIRKSTLLQFDEPQIYSGGPITTRFVIPAGFLSVVCTNRKDAEHILHVELIKLCRVEGIVIKSIMVRPSVLTCYSEPRTGEKPTCACQFGPDDIRPAITRYAAFCILHGYGYLPGMEPGADPVGLSPETLRTIGIRIGRLEGRLGTPDEFEPEPFQLL